MEKRKKTDTVQLKLRLREELRARVAKAAQLRKVSLNTEIIERLDKYGELENRLSEVARRAQDAESRAGRAELFANYLLSRLREYEPSPKKPTEEQLNAERERVYAWLKDKAEEGK